MFGFVILGGLTVFFGLQIRTERTIAADKVRFAQAEKDIEDISADIVATVGEPLEIKKQQYCSRPNMKYGQGGTACYIDNEIFSPLRGNDIIEQYQIISGTIQKRWDLLDVEKSENLSNIIDFGKIDNSIDTKIFETYGTEDKDLQCRATYKVVHIQGIAKSLSADLSCNAAVAEPVY